MKDCVLANVLKASSLTLCSHRQILIIFNQRTENDYISLIFALKNMIIIVAVAVSTNAGVYSP